MSMDFLEEAVLMKESAKHSERVALSAKQLLRDALCVMNAHAVGHKTQEAIEKFLGDDL